MFISLWFYLSQFFFSFCGGSVSVVCDACLQFRELLLYPGETFDCFLYKTDSCIGCFFDLTGLIENTNIFSCQI